MGLWLEAGAMALISALAVLGNLLVVSTLLRRSLLHHPSNRLVLSLTGSNLILVAIVLPGMVTSVLIGPSAPIANTYSNNNITNTNTTSNNSISILTALNHSVDTGQSKESLFLNPLETNKPIRNSATSSSLPFNNSKNKNQSSSSSKNSSQDMYRVSQFSNEEVSYIRSVHNEGVQNEEISYIGSEDIIVIRDGHLPATGLTLERFVGDIAKDYEGVNYISDGTSTGRTFITDSDYNEDQEESSGGSFGLCQASAFLTNLVTSASALTVAVIALDRYLAIVRPMVYGMLVTGGRCVLLLAWCWGQALLTAIPPLVGWARYERGKEGWCGVDWSSTPSYTAFWVLTIVIMPIIVMLVCYYFILQVARNKCRRIHVGILGGTPPPTPDPPSGAATEVTQQERPLDNQLSENQIEVFIDQDVVGHLRQERVRSKSLAGTNGVINKCCVLQVPDSNVVRTSPDIRRALADHGRSASFCQHQAPPPRPCLRRVQSSVQMRPSLRQKFSRASRSSRSSRKPSWSWEASPAKGFRTVLVVVGTHVLTWLPYSLMAVTEAALGSAHSDLMPRWIRVSTLLLLFLASVFHPIVYGLYNRSIRKEVRYCLWPGSRKMKHQNGPRRPSQVHSITGSVLDFSSLKMRAGGYEEARNSIASSVGGPTSPNTVATAATINTIYGGLPTPPILPSGGMLPPLLLLAAQEVAAPVGWHIKSSRKPSQDSGAVMGCSDELECEAFYCAPLSLQLSRRKYSTGLIHSRSAPCLPSLHDSTTLGGSHCGEPHTGLSLSDISSHDDVHTRVGSTRQRKLTSILPLSPQLLMRAKAGEVEMRKTISCEHLNNKPSEIGSVSSNQIKPCRVSNRTLRTKYSLGTGMPKEVQFADGEKKQRRRGSIVIIPTQTVIPEDSGILEDPECEEIENRRIIVAGDINKIDATRQISIDEGIGTECLGEDDDGIDLTFP
ncbi:unnamed protein product, partial [Meganyctiphanes norvegica]